MCSPTLQFLASPPSSGTVVKVSFTCYNGIIHHLEHRAVKLNQHPEHTEACPQIAVGAFHCTRGDVA